MSKAWIGALLGGALALTSLQAAAQQTIKVTVIAGHPPVFPWVKLLDEFYIPEVTKRLAGKVTVDWTKGFGGTIAKLGTESGALKDGLAEIAIVSTVFEAAKFPLQNITYVTPFSTDSIEAVTKAIAALQKQFPAMNDAWGKNDLTFLGGTALEPYHLFSNFQANGPAAIKGHKLLAPGPAANWIKDTGAVAVAGTLNTYYNDIKTGVAEGALTFIGGAAGAKLVEVAPYMTKVNYGSMFGGALAARKSFLDKLPADVRKVFLDVGDEWADKLAVVQIEKATKDLAAMQAAGLKVREVSKDEVRQWAMALPNIAQAWAKGLDAKGLPGTEVLKAYMAFLQKNGQDPARDWSK